MGRRLLLASALMLFIELGLIRWTGAYNVYLSFFTNFILLASFLGIGLGFLRQQGRAALFGLTPWFLVALVGFLAVFPVAGGRADGVLTVVGAFGMPALPKWVSLGVVFVLSVGVMAGIASGVAMWFGRFEPLVAYRLDIVGSLLGVGGFALLSLLELPPLAWGILVATGLVAAGARRGWRGLLPIGAFVLVLTALSVAPRTDWSPYQRITTTAVAPDGSFGIDVNGRPHQRVMPVAFMRSDQAFRFVPYARSPGNPLSSVLVIGAGSGNDAAIALAEGAAHVDAVEIDPVLVRLGLERHPDHPYQDPRVSVHVDDARAFLHGTDDRYDLVLFAIPDSLAALAGQSSLRLESYLFTREALEEVRDHLAPGGAVAMYHYYLPVVVDRYGAALAAVFGTPPCLDVSEGAGARARTVLTVSEESSSLACDATWQPSAATPTTSETDDYPFPYLAGRGVPPFYVVALLAIAVASLAAIRLAGGPSLAQVRPYLDLACMGAAFLLLETTNVVRFALFFGTTWIVNALVFGGILASVLIAIEVAARRPARRVGLLFTLLFASIAVAFVVPPRTLLDLAPIPRFAAATILGFTPVFLGNLIFANRFRDVASSTLAFGANLLGAIAGGLFEYTALAVGYRALLPVVALAYAAAFLAGRHAQAGPAPPIARGAPDPAMSAPG